MEHTEYMEERKANSGKCKYNLVVPEKPVKSLVFRWIVWF